MFCLIYFRSVLLVIKILHFYGFFIFLDSEFYRWRHLLWIGNIKNVWAWKISSYLATCPQEPRKGWMQSWICIFWTFRSVWSILVVSTCYGFCKHKQEIFLICPSVMYFFYWMRNVGILLWIESRIFCWMIFI